MRLFRKWFVLCLICLAVTAVGQEREGRLLRFPDIYKDKVVFVYGADLWLASTNGGIARRITTHPGRELFPKFSPDGKWIAFTGQYDGNFNVYVMPAEGGQPKQLTYYQGSAQPLSDRMLAVGLLGEMQVRHYHEPSRRAPYSVDRVLRSQSEEHSVSE